MKLIVCIILIILFAFAVNTGVSGERGGEKIIWHLLSGGGNKIEVGPYSLNSTVSQTVVGDIEDSVFSFHSGFWQTFEPAYLCGDANGDDELDISDAVYLINYVFMSGPTPNPPESGEVNCDGSVDISDAYYIINFVFNFGNRPCDINGDGIPDC